MRQQNYRLLCAAALASLLLLSGGCSNVSDGLTIPPAPPQASRPCALPYRDKAQDLPAQTNLDAPLPGDEMSMLWKGDIAAFNDLKPKFNANIDWAGEHCIAAPPKSTEPPKKENSSWWPNPFK